MKKIGRRGFLGVMGASPFVGKAVVEDAIEQLNNGAVLRSGLVSMSAKDTGQASNPAIYPKDWWPSQEHFRIATMHPKIRSELESMYFEGLSRVTELDHDLAIKRSWSVSAKIAFQRQRIVKGQVDGLGDPQRTDTWGKIVKIMTRYFNPFGALNG